MKEDTIVITWSDLTPACQAKILDRFGCNLNFDVIPICVLEAEEGESV